jgi:hypothetical protein
MADKMQTPVLDRAEDTARYQPLSLLAVAAVLASGILTVIIVLLTAAGLYSRKPVLEPFLILLAVGGVILALAARWHIANSEGTRAGLRLTKIALWMSVICGLCYGAYFGGNYFAIRQQANDIVMKNWFEPLKEGKIDEAYFYTIDPVQRQNISSRDVSGRFAEGVQKFRSQELVLLLDRARQDARIEPRGVQSWSKETVGYVVNLNYLVTTREGEFDVVLSVIGSDSKDLQRREWYVQKTREQVQGRRLTTYGRLVMELQLDADRFMRDWLMAKAAAGREEERYLDTVPISPEQRRLKLKEDSVRLMLSRIMVCGAQTPCGLSQAMLALQFFGVDAVDRLLYFPNGAALAKQIVTLEKAGDAPSQDFKNQVMPKFLQDNALTLPRIMAELQVPTVLEINSNEIRVSLPVLLQMPLPTPYQYKGRIFVSTKDSALLKKVQELQSAPWPAPIVVDTSATVLGDFQVNWYISEVHLDPTPQVDARMEKMMGQPKPMAGPGSAPAP